MTLQQAIMDKNRPLSVTPQQWMQYSQAQEYEEQVLVENKVKTIIAQEQSQIIPEPDEKLDIGIQQMVLGCRIAMKSLRELERLNLSPDQRKVYLKIKDLMNNAVAPYLADILQVRKGLYK